MNVVALSGNIGRDPELEYLSSGTAIVKFSLATRNGVKNKQTGEWENQSEWHNCIAFGKRAETIAQYVKKGEQLTVSGKLQQDSWVDRETQQKRYATKVLVNDFNLHGGNKKNDSADNQAPNPYQNQVLVEDEIPF